MFPTGLLFLFRRACFLLCFPLGKLPLSFLALEKLLNLWEQDTGQGLYLMGGYSRAVVVDFLFSRHREHHQSEAVSVKQVCLKHNPVPSDEAAPCVLGYLLVCAAVAQDNAGKNTVRSTAYPEIQVALDLTGDNIGVRALGGKYQVNTKGPPQPCQGRQPVFDFAQRVLVLFAPARPVQHFRNLVTGENQPGQSSPRDLVVFVNAVTPSLVKHLRAAFLHRHQLVKSKEQAFFVKAHTALLPPDFGEVHPALEVG